MSHDHLYALLLSAVLLSWVIIIMIIMTMMMMNSTLIGGRFNELKSLTKKSSQVSESDSMSIFSFASVAPFVVVVVVFALACCCNCSCCSWFMWPMPCLVFCVCPNLARYCVAGFFALGSPSYCCLDIVSSWRLGCLVAAQMTSPGIVQPKGKRQKGPQSMVYR